MSLVLSNKALLQQVEEMAEQEQREPEAILTDALRAYRERPQSDSTLHEVTGGMVERYQQDSQKMSGIEFLLSIAGQGTSNEDDVSERIEEILAAEVDPVRGLRPKQADESSD